MRIRSVLDLYFPSTIPQIFGLHTLETFPIPKQAGLFVVCASWWKFCPVSKFNAIESLEESNWEDKSPAISRIWDFEHNHQVVYVQPAPLLFSILCKLHVTTNKFQVICILHTLAGILLWFWSCTYLPFDLIFTVWEQNIQILWFSHLAIACSNITPLC